MKNNGQKVFVGISGGVDSSVAAYLLKKEGYEVHGVFIKTWAPDWLPCTWVDEKRDAMRVCAALGIPFHFLDCEEEYKKEVAEYMIEEYRAGRTPNPDVLCNKVIKFGSFLRFALEKGADFIATGHYARVTHGEKAILESGVDAAKDQSYFLWMLSQEQLSLALFPIGHLKKSSVRNIAARAGLFTSQKKDSQGICFLGDVDMKEFLGHYIKQKPGKVLNQSKEVIGVHTGAWFYTIGERHGFTITTGDRSVPYFVTHKDVEKNTITVSKDSPETFTREPLALVLKTSNWILTPEKAKTYKAQIRYHAPKVACTVSDSVIHFKSHPGAVTAGQSVVLYDGDTCIGGGVIA